MATTTPVDPTTTSLAVSTAIVPGNLQLAQSKVITTAASSSQQSSGKRGLGWDRSAASSVASILEGVTSWYFNWSPLPSAGMPASWEFYANIWGSQGIENLASELTGSPKLIGFNEPDSASQSNIGVAEAISLYQEYLVPLKSSGKISELGTPAVTNSIASGQGLDYLSDFVNGCTGCDLDFAVVHWYNEDLLAFQSFVTEAHQRTGLPVNVAEFAYTYDLNHATQNDHSNASRVFNSADEPSADEVMSFMTQAIAWLDEQSFVSAYAWFGSMWVSEASYPGLGSANSLIDESLDALTALGAAYCE